MQAVNPVRSNVKRSVESKRHIGFDDIVVDCLGNADHIQTFVAQ